MKLDDPGTDAGWAWWWAVLRTERDRRTAAQRGRPITAPNLRRLLLRRVAWVGRWRLIGIAEKGLPNMESLPSSFEGCFRRLTGNPPYPWQRRLFDQFVGGDLPDALDIPTGLGKTSVIPIWMLAHLLGDLTTRPPMRLVYVVDRRTIVDQASEQACRLRNLVTPSATASGDPASDSELVAIWQLRFGKTPLSVSTLRGALADNRDWMRYPDCPSILIGTVDMIGSRLLFGGYRAGRWTQAMHAGLLGQDSLIVHDEAHLSQPFQSLLDWIRWTQIKENSPRPLQVLAMSATGQGGSGRTLNLDSSDLDLSAVQARIHARKILFLHEPMEKQSLAEKLADLAFADEAAGLNPKRVIVFVRTPKVAGAVMHRLKSVHKVSEDRIELLTGTIRGYERDALVKTTTLRHLLNVPDLTPLEKSVYLVSTSAGELGADFDADHLVCDIAPLDSMIQRLGRVNRRGVGHARVDMLVDVKAGDKTVNSEHMVRTADWLRRLPADVDQPTAFDASPRALRNLRTADKDSYEAAIPPAPQTVEPHAVTLDAWAMTSIQEDWAIAPPLDVYLHGVEEYSEPQTTVAWRDELSLFLPPQARRARASDSPEYDVDERLAQFGDWLDVCPLRPRETVSNKSAEVMSVLCAIASRRKDEETNIYFVRIRRREAIVENLVDFTIEYESKDKNGQQGFLREKAADQTFIFPSDFGGLSSSGSLDAASSHKAKDVADAALDADLEQVRIWLSAPADQHIVPAVIGNSNVSLDGVDEPNDLSNLNQWRDKLAAHHRGKLKLVRQMVLKTTNRVAGRLLLFKPPSKEKASNDQVFLEAHGADVGSYSAKYAGQLVSELGIGKAVAAAGFCHDLGKDRLLWQSSIKNDAPGAKPLAKSFGKGMNPSLLRGYRHEYGSALDALMNETFQALGNGERELALHLICVHHGRGRPHFHEGAFNPGRENEPIPEHLLPAQVACRYAALQRRFGHWGLAWIESLVMCADHNASRGETPEDE